MSAMPSSRRFIGVGSTSSSEDQRRQATDLAWHRPLTPTGVQHVDQHERERQADRARVVREELVQRGVVALATTSVDNSGITRVKAVPIGRLEHAAAWGIGASPVFDAFLADDSIVAGRYAGGPVGDLRLHPDLDRVVVLAEQPGWAWAPANRYQQDGVVHP